MKLKKILFGVLTIAASVMLSAGIAACKDKDENSSVGASGSVASSTVPNSSNTQNDGSSSVTNSDTTSSSLVNGGETNNSSENSNESSDTSKNENGLCFKTLTLNGLEAYGKVSNDTEVFSFVNEITVVGSTKFVVSLDVYGIQTVVSKTIPLEMGDNIVYVTETMDDEPINVYKVVVRRRPMYEVTFNPNGGTAVDSQTIEEDYCASAPTQETTRAGYTFDKWNFDFATPITGNTIIDAKWTANTNTPYKVEYYLQNLENDEYTLQSDETENKTGTTDTTATAEIKTFAHFTHKPTATDCGNIDGNGSRVLKVYYTRDTYTITFDGNGGTLASGLDSQTVKYGGSVVAPTFTMTGYSFVKWNKSLDNISENQTITAQWKINQYTVTLVYGNGQVYKTVTQDYNTKITVQDPTLDGYTFDGWDKELIVPAYDTTITAKWLAIFMRNDNSITGLTDHGKTLSTIVVPSKIDDVDITSIGSGAFSGCSALEEITLPFVGAEAGKTSNDTYQYPFGHIFGTSSYTGGTATKQYYYGSSTYSTTYNTYYIPSSLKKVTVTGGNILYGAFYACSSLTSVTIPDSVTSIGGSAFKKCSSLTSIEIPDSVTSIGSGTFNGCSSLEKITIPFVGAKAGKTSNDTYQYPFGYIFGISSYTGGTATQQYYYGSSTFSTTSTTYYIPSSLKKVTVTGGNILYGAFYDCSSLTSVEIPDSVTSIGAVAFYYCSRLTSVVIPDSVTSIGSSAFYYCSSLTSVTIPDSVTSIGNEAFSGCSGLTSVTIGNGVASIGNEAFSGCGLEEIIWNAEDCTSAGSYDYPIFSDCENLTKITIGETVKTIPSYAFKNCSSLTSITIPNSVTSIGGNAFSKCSSLTSITIPDSVTSIHSFAFGGCSSLTSVTIGNSVTSIGDGAFSGCSGLQEVIWNAKNCISAGSYDYPVFRNCGNFTKVTIGKNVKTIPCYAFKNCSGLTSVTIPDSVTLIGARAFSSCGLEEVIWNAEDCTSAGSYDSPIFSDCENLTKITIGETVKTIPSYAFYYCSSLTNVYYGGTIDDWVQIAFGNYAANPLCYAKNLYIDNKLVTEANITTATKISAYAFYNCRSLTSVTIGNSVTLIGKGAFSGCSSLTSITIPDSVTSIGYSAFNGCSKLEEITIPFVGAEAGKTSNDTYQYPFGYIFGTSSYTGGTATKQYYYGSSTSSTTSTTYYIPSRLKNVMVKGGNILSYAFHDCSGLTSITLGNSVTSIGSSVFSGCSSLTSVTLPDSVTSIGGYAFSGCSSLTSVTIGNGVTSIGKRTFNNCSSLKSVTIPDSVTSIGDYAFYNCSSLKSVTIPDSVTSIGSYAFYYCSSLTSVTIGDNVTSIGESAFYNCSSLKSVTIPDSVTSIGCYAFSSCSSLTSVTIGDNVTSIGNEAFYYCSSLTSVTFSDTTTWYITNNSTDWENKRNGTVENVTDSSKNATYFRSYYHYWYKE